MAFKKLKDRLSKPPEDEGEALDLEKGDLPAMFIAGFLTLILPAILMAAVIFGVAMWFFRAF